MILYTYKKHHNNSIKNHYLLDTLIGYGIIYMLVGYFNFDWGFGYVSRFGSRSF